MVVKYLHIIKSDGRYTVQASEHQRPHDDDVHITTESVPTFAHTLKHKESAEREGVTVYRWHKYVFPTVWYRKIRMDNRNGFVINPQRINNEKTESE